jgi:hypothetical protein
VILNILIYFCLLFFPILFLFKKKIMKPNWVFRGVFSLSLFFFLLNLTFFSIYFFSYCKKNSFKEKPFIKLYKVHGYVHKFGWLTWFLDLASLTFFKKNYFNQHLSIELVFDFMIIYFCYHIVK